MRIPWQIYLFYDDGFLLLTSNFISINFIEFQVLWIIKMIETKSIFEREYN